MPLLRGLSFSIKVVVNLERFFCLFPFCSGFNWSILLNQVGQASVVAVQVQQYGTLPPSVLRCSGQFRCTLRSALQLMDICSFINWKLLSFVGEF